MYGTDETTEVVTIQPNSPYLFDLADSKRKPLNIGEQWTISFPEPKKLFLIPSRRIYKDVLLSIQHIVCPDVWIADTNKLFSALIPDGSVDLAPGKEVRITLTSTQTHFRLFLNTTAITDCREQQTCPSKVYAVSFSLLLTDIKKNEICKTDYRIKVQFSPVRSVPEVKIVLNTNSITYTSELAARIQKIGTLKIGNNSPLDYFPFINCDVLFEARNEKNRMKEAYLYLDNNPESNAHPNSIEKLSFIRNEEKVWNIMADFAKIGNPHEKDSTVIEMSVAVKYQFAGDTLHEYQLPAKLANFTLHRDPQAAELFVQVYDAQTETYHELKNGELVSLSEFSFLPGNHLVSLNELILSNLAENGKPDTGIMIKNFGCQPEIIPEIHNVTFNRNNVKNETDVFTLTGDSLMQLSEGYLLENNGAKTALQFGFKGDDFKYIYHIENNRKVYSLRIRYTVSFDYYLNNDGYRPFDCIWEEEFNRFSATIEVPVYQQPYQDWLGIDFGTSAIVCQYGDKLLDLHSIKRNLFDDSPTDNYEPGTPFLSSNLIFRDHPRINEPISQLLTEYDHTHCPDYKELAVCLSPTSIVEDNNIRSILPCLKLMAGYQYVPNAMRYRHILYKHYNEDREIVDSRIATMEEDKVVYSSLAVVDKIFEEVYKQLFIYYIKDAINQRDAQKINQIVLTVPNTYTPAHLKRLEECIKSSFHDLYIRNVRFVSESDAVACYYQKNWASINRKINRNVENSPLENQENILVYDMGAGTLDITFLNKTRTNGKTEIRVVGKVGVAKAGNYLDFILAQLLARKINQFSAYTHTNLDIDALVEARKLKEFVKNKLKPVLGIESSLTVPQNTVAKLKEDLTVDIDSLLQSDEFKQYIYDCTQGLFDNLFEFLGYKEPVQIDTVLVSGRSSKLKFIRENLRHAINRWSTDNEWVLIDMSELTEQGQYDKSKTVVVEGALAYARNFSNPNSPIKFISNNIMACYGVIYTDNLGNTQYRELLNPGENPVATYEKNGLIINEYKSTPIRLDLTLTDKLILVQTFSANTGEDWKTGDREYITEMSTYTIPAEGNRTHTELSITVDKNNIMTLRINGIPVEGLAPTKVDVNNISNQKSLWPMATN